MRILSGIQPSGTLHIGNYFGMMRPSIELQARGECFYFIADYHSMTSLTDPEKRRANTLNVALDFLACGLDPQKSVFYRQSDLPGVCELTWIIGTLTPMGLLERAHSYKDKTSRGISPNFGLFAYPVLMAADILLFDTNIVPVGKDQKQHLEMTRDMAIKFNLTYGETLVVPEERISEAVATIPGLDGQKMSKSYGNTIEIFGDPKATRKRIMSIVTDSKPLEAPKDPDTCNVFQLYKLFATPEQQADLAARYRAGGLGYGTAKKELADLFEAHFAPMRAKRAELAANPDYVERVLQQGAAKARALAAETVRKARRAVGLE